MKINFLRFLASILRCKRSNRRAFSLVEILVTLIILSIIIAAFIPLITKKIKASDITVGSFGNNGGSAIGIKRNVTKEDCDKFNALYVPAAMNDGIKPVCVTKWNIGDNVGNGGVPIAGDVQKLSVNQTCTDKGNCCWKGKTATTGCNNTGNGDSKYDGCTRTVCQWKAANTSCQSYSPMGTISGMWRLPKEEEVLGWANNDNLKELQINKGSNGLQFCDCVESEGTSQCPAIVDVCKGSTNNHCYPSEVWLQTVDTEGSHKQFAYRENEIKVVPLTDTYALSSRCVLDSISDIVPTGNETDMIDNKLDSQGDCDKLGAGLLFIPKSATGTKNMCVMKYNIGDMGNENWAGVKKCATGDTTCTIENAKDYANAKDVLQPACWQGTTANSTTCTSDFGGYSGCTRTICNWTGGKKMCENFRLGTYGWRLPTIGELRGFANTTYSNKTLASKGLMLCTHLEEEETTDEAPVCARPSGCYGTNNNNCYPLFLWSSTLDSSTKILKGWNRFLHKNYYDAVEYLNMAYSIRCVLDEDAYRRANTNQIMPTETEFSSSCDTGCALCGNDKCYVCKQGYELKNGKCETHCLTMNNGICVKCEKGYALLNGKCLTCDPSNGFIKVNNLCVMQYNIGDGYYKETWGGVQKCIAGQDCTVQNGKSKEAKKDNLTPTCWQGKTGGEGCNANFGGYDGCTRTVCNWTGANQICTNVGWRLPTKEELATFTNDTYSSKTAFESGNGSLMFCDRFSNPDSPLCSYASSCSNTYNDDCNPFDLWSSSFKTDSIVWGKYFGTNWADDAYYLGYGFSARCVKDL